MEDWIDIVKERLQDAQATLPPNDWAEFEASSLPAKRPRVLPWLIPALTVAAGLAAVLFLRQPTVSDDGVQVVQQPSAPVAVVPDTADADELEMPLPIVAQAVMPRVRPADVKPQAVVDVEETSPIEDMVVVPKEEENVPPETRETVPPETKETVTPGPVIPSSSPFVPENSMAKPVTMKVVPAVGAVAGSGLLAALVLPSLGESKTMKGGVSPYNGGMSYPYYGLTSDSGEFAYTGSNPGSNPLMDQIVGVMHHLPLKLGLSVRMPVADRLYVSTGLDYSRYQSTFTYSLSGEQMQYAHYLGIPVRLDWVFASGRFLEAYVGGGLEGEVCVGATFGGKAISKDGFNLSLQGAGGIQMNVTRRLGIYVEPQVMWRIPTGDSILQTYRSTHPLMFSAATGVRFTIGK